MSDITNNEAVQAPENASEAVQAPDTPDEAVKAQTVTKRDWVEEACKSFIENADLDPTDPVKAIEAYFKKNARDELKARAASEGKTAKSCWDFISAVARKALHGSNGHIDPTAVYAIAMHYFEDVPVDWDGKAEHSSAIKTPKPEGSGETGEPTRKKTVRKAKKTKSGQKKHYKKTQGFFFDMMEEEVVTPEGGAE